MSEPAPRRERIDRANKARHPESSVSAQECVAMRALDRDDEYTRSEIAFMFESKSRTVARHCDRECHHQIVDDDGEESIRKWTDGQLLNAFRIVYDRQPYEQMSQRVYEEERPDDFPSKGTICRVFGSWTQAREQARGSEECDPV